MYHSDQAFRRNRNAVSRPNASTAAESRRGEKELSGVPGLTVLGKSGSVGTVWPAESGIWGALPAVGMPGAFSRKLDLMMSLKFLGLFLSYCYLYVRQAANLIDAVDDVTIHVRHSPKPLPDGQKIRIVDLDFPFMTIFHVLSSPPFSGLFAAILPDETELGLKRAVNRGCCGKHPPVVCGESLFC